MNKVRRKNFRENINQDDYWMGLAFWIAAGSRNPTNPQGAVIVGPQGNLLAQGFDCPPKCMYDGEYMRPAEKAAIQDTRFVIFTGSTLYTTHTPSAEAILDVVAADIKRVVYFPTQPLSPAAQEIIQQAYGQVQEFRGNLSWMRDHISVLKSLGVFS
jgi:deoxycytidylate deaminase